MNVLHLVSASAEVRPAPQEPLTVSTPGLPGGIYGINGSDHFIGLIVTGSTEARA
jgi:hypothetical protein